MVGNREVEDLSWLILTVVAFAGGCVLGVILEGTLRTDVKLRDRTIECVTQPQKCKTRFDYYMLDLKK